MIQKGIKRILNEAKINHNTEDYKNNTEQYLIKEYAKKTTSKKGNTTGFP